MSSTEYSTELAPDNALRRIVLGTGASLFILGAIAILTLPIDVAVRLAVIAAWTLLLTRELRRFRAGFVACRGIRLHAGGAVVLLTRGGREIPARLAAGSVVLQRLAWLRFRTECGLDFAELLIGNSRENEAWRRLQVIWRHLGAPR